MTRITYSLEEDYGSLWVSSIWSEKFRTGRSSSQLTNSSLSQRICHHMRGLLWAGSPGVCVTSYTLSVHVEARWGRTPAALTGKRMAPVWRDRGVIVQSNSAGRRSSARDSRCKRVERT